MHIKAMVEIRLDGTRIAWRSTAGYRHHLASARLVAVRLAGAVVDVDLSDGGSWRAEFDTADRVRIWARLEVKRARLDLVRVAGQDRGWATRNTG